MTKLCVRDRVVCGKLCVGNCVCEKRVCAKIVCDRRRVTKREDDEEEAAGYRIKNKTPTHKCVGNIEFPGSVFCRNSHQSTVVYPQNPSYMLIARSHENKKE